MGTLAVSTCILFLLALIFYMGYFGFNKNPEIKSSEFIGYNQTLISNVTKSGQVIATEENNEFIKAKVNFGNQNFWGNPELETIYVKNYTGNGISGKYIEFTEIILMPQNCRYTTEYNNGTVIISDFDEFRSPTFFPKCHSETNYYVNSILERTN